MEYRGVLESTGGNNAAFVIPDDLVERLGAGGRPKVAVTVAGMVFRTSIAKMGGQYLLGINKARRDEAGLGVGGTYSLVIEPDTAGRTIELPVELAAAIDGDPAAREFWDQLSFSNKRRFAEPIEAAKKPETRERRIAKAAEALRAGKII